jgi:hypothetical protein
VLWKTTEADCIPVEEKVHGNGGWSVWDFIDHAIEIIGIEKPRKTVAIAVVLKDCCIVGVYRHNFASFI